jgi:hypothetical protein
MERELTIWSDFSLILPATLFGLEVCKKLCSYVRRTYADYSSYEGIA